MSASQVLNAATY